MKLTLLTTGGTIDGADSDKNTLRQASSAAKWLREHSGLDVTEIAICNKDSRQIAESDRQKMIEEINRSNNPVFITHGTYTIAETGRILKESFLNSDKTIFLIGSWLPFGEKDSDAEAQMKFAVKELFNNKSNGVFIAMDGQLWNPDITEKYETSPGKFSLRRTV